MGDQLSLPAAAQKMCVCVHVRERETETERQRQRKGRVLYMNMATRDVHKLLLLKNFF